MLEKIAFPQARCSQIIRADICGEVVVLKFSALYNEYRGIEKCSIDFNTVYSIVGGAPGYLAELCQGERAVARFIE